MNGGGGGAQIQKDEQYTCTYMKWMVVVCVQLVGLCHSGMTTGHVAKLSAMIMKEDGKDKYVVKLQVGGQVGIEVDEHPFGV